ncbi:MAG: GFA family protein [Rhodobiaceae bacterium]|nr:GFA family protein [Alphaproteobacteria bacterium]MCB1471837.1 GFA family protein [Rhodobiaceae bacterium]
MKRQASCSCGKLKVTCPAEPRLVSLCHCTACQKRTGSPYGIAAFFSRLDVEITGDFNSWRRSSDNGFEVEFHFCPECGATVFWEPGRKPSLIAVGVGSFGDPSFPAPTQEVHVESRHNWVCPLRTHRP